MKSNLELELEKENLQKEIVTMRWERDCLNITIKDKQETVSKLEEKENLLTFSVDSFNNSLELKKKSLSAELDKINLEKTTEIDNKQKQLEVSILESSKIISDKAILLDNLVKENAKYSDIESKIQVLSLKEIELEALKNEAEQSIARSQNILLDIQKREEIVANKEKSIEIEKKYISDQKIELENRWIKALEQENILSDKIKKLDGLIKPAQEEHDKMVYLKSSAEWILASNKIKKLELDERETSINNREKQLIDKENEIQSEKNILKEEQLKFRETKADFELNYRQAMVEKREALIGNK